MRTVPVLRRLVSLVLFAAVVGVVVGTGAAIWEVWTNDWAYYGLTGLISWELTRSWTKWIQISLIVIIAGYSFRRLLALMLQKDTLVDRAFSASVSLLLAGALTVSWGFHTNRYTYKSLWQAENTRLLMGIQVPEAIFSPKLIAINLFILVTGTLAAVVIYKLCRFLYRRTRGLFPWMERRWAWTFAACVSVLSVPLFTSLGSETSTRPNIILISIDTLRADHLSCYEYQRRTSPNIDALAHGGALFENAISQSNWTLPSHMSIMTSQIPRSHGIQTIEQRLPKFKVTLAEVLRNAGYTTVAFTGGYNVDARFGFDQGFDTYHGDKVYYLTLEEKVKYGKGVRLSYLLPEVLNWLSSHKDEPFFMFLHCWDTHAPYMQHEEFVEEFSPGYTGSISMVTHELVSALNSSSVEAPAEDVERIRALYDNEIRYVDTFLGRFFDAIDRWNLFEKTIIVLTSDHGDELLEHGFGHGLFLHEPEIHVPLIVSYPHVIPAGIRVGDVVQSIDIMPTLLELAGLTYTERVEAELQGKSLSRLLERSQHDSVAFSEGDTGREICLRTGRYKLIASAQPDSKQRKVQLYDILRDPAENIDISSTETELTLRMQGRLEKYLRSLPSVRFSGTTDTTDISNDFIEQLRTLGYVQ